VAKNLSAIRVKVPATSANLGPAFDSAGLALTLFDEIEVSFTDTPGVQVDIDGFGRNTLPRNQDHLIAKVMLQVFETLEVSVSGLYLRCINKIPHGRGLGSSAAAITAGVVAARALAGEFAKRMDDAGALDFATKIEGHPDNVAACLLGGFTLSWTDSHQHQTESEKLLGHKHIHSDGVHSHAVKLKVHPEIVPVVFIPKFEMETKKARLLLPSHIPHRDAAFNVARSALLVSALTENPELLFVATEDKLHQPYRRNAMQTSGNLIETLRGRGLAAMISGAGPAVLVLTTQEELATVREFEHPDFSMQVLEVSPTGAQVL
jgi:homoserine kinase